jgi:hypothetical protein
MKIIAAFNSLGIYVLIIYIVFKKQCPFERDTKLSQFVARISIAFFV